MPKFTFICDHSCDLDTHVVRHDFNAVVLSDVLENFQMFLKGAGYVFDGDIEIVPTLTQEFTKDESYDKGFHGRSSFPQSSWAGNPVAQDDC